MRDVIIITLKFSPSVLIRKSTRLKRQANVSDSMEIKCDPIISWSLDAKKPIKPICDWDWADQNGLKVEGNTIEMELSLWEN
jgi:hypothetical protein